MNSLTILTLVIIAAANMAVGGCIGICGIAGFLLPMLYTGGLGFDVTYALALSFLAFLVSGIIGSFNYYKAGNLDVKMSLKLGIGSLIGAIAGVFLQSMIEKSTAKTIFIWWYCFPVLPFWSGCGMKNGKRILSLQRKLFPMKKIQHLLILPIQNLLQTIWDS